MKMTAYVRRSLFSGFMRSPFGLPILLGLGMFLGAIIAKEITRLWTLLKP